MSHPQEIAVSRRSQPWYQRFPDREFADTCELTCEEFGFLQRLRDFSMVRGGIPDDEDIFKRLAKTFHLSKYKLKKLWPVLENFFTLRDGVFYYERDETARLQVIDDSHKRRVAGRLGAEVRWSKKVAEFPKQVQEMDGNAISEQGGLPSQKNGKLELYTDTYLEQKLPPAAVPDMEPEAAEAAPPQEKILQDKILKVQERCRQLDLQLPDRKLCIRLIERFPTIEPDLWPKFHDQHSPGLWLEKSADDMTQENFRQQNVPKKKSLAEKMADEYRRARQAKGAS